MDIVQISARIARSEFEQLERYCERTARNKTDVLRELIRSLPNEDGRVQNPTQQNHSPKS
jgi:hypothetical protein